MGCGGASARDGQLGSDQGGAPPAGASGGGASGQADDEPPVHEVAEFCARTMCPPSASDVAAVCKVCPPGPEGLTPECRENIFGGTSRYVSSCGGDSVEVHVGFDRTVWNFDADGQLIGVEWGSDTSSELYGRQCARLGEPQDLCL